MRARTLVVLAAWAGAACSGAADLTDPVVSEDSETTVDPPAVDTSVEGPAYAPPVTCPAGASADDHRKVVRRWPYLQQVDRTGVTVVTGVVPGAGTVVVEATRDGQTVQATASGGALAGVEPPMDLVSARLDGLEPGTSYCYRVLVDGVEVAGGLTLQTRPTSRKAPVRFVVLGDFGSGTAEQEALRDVMMDHLDGVQFWLTTGDNAYGEGTAQQFQDYVFEVYREVLAEVPILPTPGNHDYKTDDLQPYLDSFFLPEQAYTAWGQERYYRQDWGALRVLALDCVDSLFKLTNEPADDEIDWLRDQANDPTTQTGPVWTTAAFHYPPFSGQPDRGPDIFVKAFLEPALEELKIPLVLTGHNHMYERFVPLREGQPVPEGSPGTTYIVTGGGGRGLYDIGPDSRHAAVQQAHHFMLFDVDEQAIRGQAIGLDGTVIDSFEIRR